MTYFCFFLAPTGAQGVTMSVRLSVCSAQYVQEQSRSVNLHLSRSEINQRTIIALRERSENSQRALRDYSEREH